MDTRNEETMVRQIEKSLSNNMSDNLFLTGRIMEPTKLPHRSNVVYDMVEDTKQKEITEQDYPLVSSEPFDKPVGISRAEYIRLAREACLRQLSNTQIYSKPYEANYMDIEPVETEEIHQKKAKAWKLFQAPMEADAVTPNENMQQELASFRSLIIRTVCAIILFLTIFVIDKFKLDLGMVTHELIEKYVTGMDTFQELEDSVVTWINK